MFIRKNKIIIIILQPVDGATDGATRRVICPASVPMKKQGKRSKRKHLTKDAFRKIRHKQHMWRVYKHTGKDTDYDAYKEALNAATNEVRKSKRNFEHKLAQNIKSDSKSFYAYVRSKQNVRDKVSVTLEWKEANIIPLFKKGSRNKSVNYRPVSITSVICKLLETIIRDHMMDFLVKHKLINPSQHGFLKARSCLTKLLCFLSK